MFEGLTTTVVGSLPVVPPGDVLTASYYSQSDPFEGAVGRAAAIQVDAGIDIISDGQVRADMITLFASKVRGVRLRGKPIIIGELGFDRPITLEDQRTLRGILDSDPATAKTRIKGIVTGPFTMAMSCVNEFYPDTREAAFAWAGVLNQEARALEPVVDMIQFDEPFFSVEFPDYAKEVVEVVREGVGVPVALHACGDVKDIFEDLVEFPVDILDHEFKTNPHLIDLAADLSFPQMLGLGSVRSDSAEVEGVEDIAVFIRNAVSKLGAGKLLIDPDCGLRHVPLESAGSKLKNLCAARDLVRSGL